MKRRDAIAGYEHGPDASLRATADALARLATARAVILVEGISDQIAVEALAELQGRDLLAEGVVVLPIGGAYALGNLLPGLLDQKKLKIAGLCDAAEADHFGKILTRNVLGTLEAEGFFICDRDLEDELIRKAGETRIRDVLEAEGDLRPFTTLARQAEWRDASFTDQFRRFLGAGARRKHRYASLLVKTIGPDDPPEPLLGVLDRV